MTKTKSVYSILSTGLEPGSIRRCNSDRLDTLSNIYFARTLGAIDDPNGQLNGTAHWWKKHFTNDDSIDGEDWTILSVNVDSISEILVRDPWSATGLIYRAKRAISPTAIEVVG